MLLFHKPSETRLAEFLQRQSRLKFNYPNVGCTSAGEFQASNQRRYDFDRLEETIGDGDKAFDQAKRQLEQWRHFEVGWAEALPKSTPIASGNVVAVQAKFFGLWAMAPIRIIEVDDRSDDSLRFFGYSIGTLPAHPEQGEERFEIMQLVDGRVRYRITAYFRANTWMARIAWPYLRFRFNQFRRQSVAAMRQAMNSND